MTFCRNANFDDYDPGCSPYATQLPCPAAVGFARLQVNIWVLNSHFRDLGAAFVCATALSCIDQIGVTNLENDKKVGLLDWQQSFTGPVRA